MTITLYLLVVVLCALLSVDTATEMTSCPSPAENVFRVSHTTLERPLVSDTIIVKNTRMQEFTCAYDLSQPFTRFSPAIASTYPEQFLCHDSLIYQDSLTSTLQRLCLARLIVNGAIIDTTTLIPDVWHAEEDQYSCMVGGTTVFTNRAQWNPDCQSIDLPSGYHREHSTTRELLLTTMRQLNLTWQDLVTYDQLPSPQNITQSLFRLQAIGQQHLIANFLPSYYYLSSASTPSQQQIQV